MRTITLFEHGKTGGWTDRDLSLLERLNHVNGADVLRATVDKQERVLRATHYVGVVRLGKRTIQILPKIYRATDEEQQLREATRNLLYMLAYAGRLPIREHALAPLLRQNMDWFEILTRLFATHLLQEWQRGAYRRYQNIEDELPLLKGKWRVPAQLRHPERQHLFAVSYDEFTADNPLNRVFRFVVERLWRLTRHARTRQHLNILRQWLEEITLLAHITVTDADRITLTRLNQQYAPLLNLARLFLDNSALQLTASDLMAFTFVFDMNRLFEEFLVNFIRRHRAAILPPALRDCVLLPQTRHAARYLARREGENVFRLQPDLALCKGKQFPLLVDAKYKQLESSKPTRGVTQADFYQMYAYAQRYNCPRVVLIYPQAADMRESVRARFTLASGDKVVEVATVDVQRDLGTQKGRGELVEELKTIFYGGCKNVT